jgi:hypothetical protein
MKEFYKKTEFYYFIFPALVIVWILTVSFLTLPTAESKLKRAVEEDSKIQGYVATILTIDRDRLEYKKQVEKTGKFDYGVVIDNFAKIHKIPDYQLSAQGPIKRKNQLTQSANVIISTIDIEKFAKFLSSLQKSWPNLKCDTLSLDKQKSGLDAWKATMKFTYIFDN